MHPIRILFYDRRVIMCAVMLNSTYLLKRCRYYTFFVFISLFRCCVVVFSARIYKDTFIFLYLRTEAE